MCGILGIFHYQGDLKQFRDLALKLSKRLRHRGPDWTGIEVFGKHAICHERLSIVDLVSGDQPLKNSDGTVFVVVNGEIYNHLELRRELKKERVFKSKSDCEVLLYLYEDYGPSFISKINGIFAFILYDTTQDRWLVARDSIGVVSMYYGHQGASRWFASEMKPLVDHCDVLDQVPPGHFYDSLTDTWSNYLPTPLWMTPISHSEVDLAFIQTTLVTAVHRQLMADAPFGVLLSGGLDSSLVAAIAKKHVPSLHSFSIGLQDAPDLQAAEEVAQFLGTHHHSLTFTVEQGLDALSDVIYHLETYDVTTIRASTPMFLLARKIKALGIKMVLSGEGSDELLGGYLYFHKAPTPAALHHECIRLVHALHTSDCLRANKSTMAWGLEVRVPFLDPTVVHALMSVDPALKMSGPNRIEKWVLRQSFEGWLPSNVLWRQKEQFSDGVGYSWIDQLKSEADGRVSDAAFQQRAHRFPIHTPETKEAYWYREIFESHFPQPAAISSVRRWVPQQAWGCPTDPSGRAQDVHKLKQTNGIEH